MKNFKYLFLASAFAFFFSCSTDENSNESSLEAENIEVITTTIDDDSTDDQVPQSTLRYGDITFQTNSDGTVTRTAPGQKTYTIINESVKNSSLEIRRERGSDVIQEYVITNPITRESLTINNIKEHNGYYTFDMTSDLGITAENVTFEGDLSFLQSNQRVCPPCVVIIVVVIIDAAVELLSDSPLEQCAAAMNALNCSSGNPYMDYDEGGWFSNPSCEVGCN
ncbi:hypothetical protein GCM10011344_38900 [Dokdonia pacifica]|uniref:Uncharacterized protein n=1 Tax=Dokdonia pacifica TaxID=1627892 RepID=A0A239A0G8_9FLAO|nr:hypothetical protein [Dokdonia pacifica]GGG34344.1 hypothetical protein GCM10011344_38900 [Dokdonia pacifica]SNR89135.1 hypothetical protein SAMN06265376_10468 [Dokdonia pacifica]